MHPPSLCASFAHSEMMLVSLSLISRHPLLAAGSLGDSRSEDLNEELSHLASKAELNNKAFCCRYSHLYLSNKTGSRLWRGREGPGPEHGGLNICDCVQGGLRSQILFLIHSMVFTAPPFPHPPSISQSFSLPPTSAAVPQL